MKRLFPLALLLLAACQDNRLGEDFWYANAEILCQRENCARCGETRGIICPNCQGAGVETCTVCYGDGEVTCSSCGGSGESYGDKCTACNGTGEETCGNCGGDGKQTCSVCSGKMRVACIQKIPVEQPPATRTEDAWPPHNFQGGGVDN
ncbi:MAG: hypothetical protein QF645_05450 [Planctomycetota bacterium]|nr:hypothetical protein [Planctomycetota bacterium]